MEKFVKVVMYTFIGGVLVAVGYAGGHILIGKGDVTSGAAGIAFGVGCVAGLIYGAKRHFA